MCLHTNSNKLVKTDKEITVYKVFLSDSSAKNVVDDEFYNSKLVYSCYRSSAYPIGKLVRVAKDKIIADISENYNRMNCTNFDVNTGLHSYLNCIDAQCMRGIGENVWKCTIPKGSYVIYGFFASCECVVSNQLIVNFKL